jgi:DNA-binding response OmpR family regulator
MTSVPQTILVAEDDPKTSASIKLYLENAGYHVRTAETGSDALALARRLSPALVILDIMLPHLNGLDVCRLLRAESQVPIIMLTARTLEEDRVLGFDLGADDYVTKPFSPRELVRRVQAILRRAAPSDIEFQAPQQFGNLLIDVTRHEVTIDGNPVALTATEFKLLAVICQAPGRVFTREELVERVFGNAYEGLARTIDAHVMNLRRKIKDDPRHPALILTVYGVGYKFADHVS